VTATWKIRDTDLQQCDVNEDQTRIGNAGMEQGQGVKWRLEALVNQVRSLCSVEVLEMVECVKDICPAHDVAKNDKKVVRICGVEERIIRQVKEPL